MNYDGLAFGQAVKESTFYVLILSGYGLLLALSRAVVEVESAVPY